MLLRRITKHVTDQNWFAVFIDFLIVVVGVFIGIQVANWNETRQQQNLSLHYLQRITDDLEANQLDMQQRLVYYNQTRAHGLAALNALDKNKEVLGKQFIIDIYQASQALPREIDRSSYDEINSIGAHVAIPDVKIRNRLAIYFRSVQASVNNLAEIMPYREFIRGVIPYYAQKAVRDNCDDIVSVDSEFQHTIKLPESCEISLTQEQIEEAVNVILQAKVEQTLTRQIIDLDTKISSLHIFNRRTNTMLDFLRSLP
ncbi:MAG: hypothetical protein ACSHWU_07100 [Marinicella sp.]